MKIVKFFYSSTLRKALTVASVFSFLLTWARYDFGPAKDVGILGTFLYSIFHGFAGALWGVLIAYATRGTQGIFGKPKSSPEGIINSVWLVGHLAAAYTYWRMF